MKPLSILRLAGAGGFLASGAHGHRMESNQSHPSTTSNLVSCDNTGTSARIANLCERFKIACGCGSTKKKRNKKDKDSDAEDEGEETVADLLLQKQNSKEEMNLSMRDGQGEKVEMTMSKVQGSDVMELEGSEASVSTSVPLGIVPGEVPTVKPDAAVREKLRGAIDVGSGMTKLQIVYVGDDNTMKTVFAKEWKMPYSFLFKRDGILTKQTQDQGLNVMIEVKKVLDSFGVESALIEKDPRMGPENQNVVAIGTEIFRKVKCEGLLKMSEIGSTCADGLAFLEKIREKSGIRVHLIPQEQEGNFGYLTGLANLASYKDAARFAELEFEPLPEKLRAQPIVYDSGGGSFQITTREGSTGSKLDDPKQFLRPYAASNAYATLLEIKELMDFYWVLNNKEDTAKSRHNTAEPTFVSPNPVSKAESEALFDRISHIIKDGVLQSKSAEKEAQHQSDKDDFSWLQGQEVLAIGGINSIFRVTSLALSPNGKTTHTVFSVADVKKAWDSVVGKTDEELRKKFSTFENAEGPEFVVPKIVLLYSVMNTTGIKKIHWRPAAGSCPGLLVNQLIYREYGRKMGSGQTNLSMDDGEYWATARDVLGLAEPLGLNKAGNTRDPNQLPQEMDRLELQPPNDKQKQKQPVVRVSPNDNVDKSTNTDPKEFPYHTTDHSQSFFFARNPFITSKWGRENSNLKFVLTAPGEDPYFDDQFFSLVDHDSEDGTHKSSGPRLSSDIEEIKYDGKTHFAFAWPPMNDYTPAIESDGARGSTDTKQNSKRSKPTDNDIQRIRISIDKNNKEYNNLVLGFIRKPASWGRRDHPSPFARGDNQISSEANSGRPSVETGDKSDVPLSTVDDKWDGLSSVPNLHRVKEHNGLPVKSVFMDCYGGHTYVNGVNQKKQGDKPNRVELDPDSDDPVIVIDLSPDDGEVTWSLETKEKGKKAVLTEINKASIPKLKYSNAYNERDEPK